MDRVRAGRRAREADQHEEAHRHDDVAPLDEAHLVPSAGHTGRPLGVTSTGPGWFPFEGTPPPKPLSAAAAGGLTGGGVSPGRAPRRRSPRATGWSRTRR